MTKQGRKYWAFLVDQFRRCAECWTCSCGQVNHFKLTACKGCGLKKGAVVDVDA